MASWGYVTLVAPLVVAFFVVNACLAIPPLVSYREAWRQTRELFFGEVAFPWQR